MIFEMGPRETHVLTDVIRRTLDDLRDEIWITQTADCEALLKARETVLVGLLARLCAAEASGLAIGEPASRGLTARARDQLG
jgi:hypothetical protein